MSELKWDGDAWRAMRTLRSWTGLGEGDRAPVVEVAVTSEGAPPTLAQRAALAWLDVHERAVRDVVLGALFAAYPKQRAKWLPHLDSPDVMPVLSSAEELLGRVDVRELVVHTVERDGVAYLGVMLGASWDAEHGLGVMLHRDRVVKVGGADTALLEWIAANDLKAITPLAPGAKKAAPNKPAPKKTAPKKTAPKKAAPKKTAPKKAAPKKAAPKKKR